VFILFLLGEKLVDGLGQGLIPWRDLIHWDIPRDGSPEQGLKGPENRRTIYHFAKTWKRQVLPLQSRPLLLL